MGVCLLNRSPLEVGGLASCEGPCRASSSSGDQLLAGVGVEPCCWVGKVAHLVLVQGLTGVLNLLKEPVAGGRAGSETTGHAAAATAAVV